MASYIINGGYPIRGEIKLHGAKNAALPILSAALLGREVILHNCPKLSDVNAAIAILSHLGCNVIWQDGTLILKNGDITTDEVPEKLMREMRSSIIFLGAIIAKCGSAKLSYPGGCELGARPIDMHLEALKKLGVVIKESDSYLECSVPNGLKGAIITLPFPSVGATENTMIAACAAQGETVIHNAAREPEIDDLAKFLSAMGYGVAVKNDGTVIIKGAGNEVQNCEHHVIPDRIACATYLCMAGISGGEINIAQSDPNHLSVVLPIFEEMGCKIRTGENFIRLSRDGPLSFANCIRTMPYPGFPTDAQSPLMALSTVAKGRTAFEENIFESRYKHVGELIRMGADIEIDGKIATVNGVDRLHGATVTCTDLRGGAAVCVAAIAAEGETVVREIKHILRGYDSFTENLKSLGVKIREE